MSSELAVMHATRGQPLQSFAVLCVILNSIKQLSFQAYPLRVFSQGPFYASRASSEAPSMLNFRHLESWAANADWTLALPDGEDALAVAAGRSFCAVATSRGLLRLFSLAGEDPEP